MLIIALASVPAHSQNPKSATPVSDPMNWITFADYPLGEAKGDFAATSYKLQVDQSGVVTGCQARNMKISPHPGFIYEGFPGLTCKLLQKRAKFFPAVGSSGNLFLQTYDGVIVWSKSVNKDGRMAFYVGNMAIEHGRSTPIPPPAIRVPPPLEPPGVQKPQMHVHKPQPAAPVLRLLSNPALLVTQADYPARALREKRAGTVAYEVIVIADGRVGACSIISSSGHPDLDAATCNLVTRRARFNMLEDGPHIAEKRIYTGRIRWVLPYTDEPTAPSSAAKR